MTQMNKIAFVGIDTAKTVFQVHAADRGGRTVWTARLKRDNWLDMFCQHVPKGAVVAVEACAASHHWCRELIKRGHAPRMIAAQFVKPYVKGNKNDRIDAAAICEAASRPEMWFVPVKQVWQQDSQALHRAREGLVGDRTAKANQIRGLTAEYGLVAREGIGHLRKALPCWLEDADNGLSDDFRALLADLADDLAYLDGRIAKMDKQIAERVDGDETARRLKQIPGIGPLNANALSAALGDASAFGRGRDFAASLGLVPRQHSSGGKDRLLGISKRGDSYLRKLLAHAARSALLRRRHGNDALGAWLRRLLARKPFNVAVVALANKMARIAWAMVRHGADYDPARANAQFAPPLAEGMAAGA